MQYNTFIPSLSFPVSSRRVCFQSVHFMQQYFMKKSGPWGLLLVLFLCLSFCCSALLSPQLHCRGFFGLKWLDLDMVNDVQRLALYTGCNYICLLWTRVMNYRTSGFTSERTGYSLLFNTTPCLETSLVYEEQSSAINLSYRVCMPSHLQFPTPVSERLAGTQV